ncbi:MAG TPA: hypothetical protein VFU81_08660 [Thermomicrobiales bacterium]|nr:hypothetical protein [Thermomicrobiales bacterium]
MNDVTFSDTPLAPGTLADYCQRFPNSPACSHLISPAPDPGPGHNGGNGDHHGHHDHNNNNHHGGHGGDGGDNSHHPVS